MIRNDHQLRVARRKLRDLRQAIESLDDQSARVSFEMLAADVEAEVEDYLQIKSGERITFDVASIDDLANALVSARIARGWTQRQLAEELDVTEQMVQKDEAGGYESAALSRLADVADVLGYELVGKVRPVQHDEHHGDAFELWEQQFSTSVATTRSADRQGGPAVFERGSAVRHLFGDLFPDRSMKIIEIAVETQTDTEPVSAHLPFIIHPRKWVRER